MTYNLMIYHMFDKVVKLAVNHRVQGMTSEQVTFRDLLLRLAKGNRLLTNGSYF